MRTITQALTGGEVAVHVVEREEDAEALSVWACDTRRRALAVDTETTGLNILAGDRVRLVQLGDTTTSWVVPVEEAEHLGRTFSVLRRVLCQAPALVCHNATFDLLALDRLGLVDLEDAYRRTTDTRILAHLQDPRARSEGGVGHGLKELCSVYVDADAPDSQAALNAVFRANRWRKSEGFARIPTDHEDFLRYAGLDTILTARLLEVLGPAVNGAGMGRLAEFEHEVAALLAVMERRGMRLDVPYTERLVGYFAEERAAGLATARQWGVENVESTAQVAAALMATGVELTERTPTGRPKVDRAVLEALAEDGHELARAITRAKRAAKFSTAYAEAMLALRDESDRIHPKINSLQARTARMSVSTPPLQQLPSGDWRIRRCLVADPEQAIVACDYAQVELRVLFGLAQERNGMAAIAAGRDLHDATAEILFGPGFTKAQRKLAKNVGFGRVYGGGAAKLARMAGVDLETAKAAMAAYDRGFPGVQRYGRGLQEWAQVTGDRCVTTPSGRRLPLDGDRLYAATNYVVQSTARDVLAQALLELKDAGLADHLLLPVHDEVIAQAPAEDAADVAEAIRRTMSMDFMGVRLDAEAEVYGPTWGHGYGASE